MGKELIHFLTERKACLRPTAEQAIL
jgi:hypothetical protein